MAVLSLTEKLNQLGTRYDELTQELSSAEIVSDSARFQKVAKQQSELGEIVDKHREFKQIEKDLAATPKRRAGKSKSSKALRLRSAASRKSSRRFKGKRSIPN
jgi:peptide chain release factor 1